MLALAIECLAVAYIFKRFSGKFSIRGNPVGCEAIFRSSCGGIFLRAKYLDERADIAEIHEPVSVYICLVKERVI